MDRCANPQIMPRDAAAPTDGQLLLRLSPGPLGPRFRVRGLRGNQALADWLCAHTPLPRGARLLAGAETGVVRFDLSRCAGTDQSQFEPILAAALDAYGVRAARPSGALGYPISAPSLISTLSPARKVADMRRRS